MKALALLLTVGVVGTGAQAHTLRLAMPPNAGLAHALSQSVLAPYTAATHRKVQIVSPASSWDVALLDPVTLAERCSAGAIRHIDWDQVGGRARFLPAATSDCGVGASLRVTVLSWDAGKIPHAASWQDFWDVARLPGRRGLQRTPVGTLEIALMSDGVPPGSVYAVLRAPGGADRAFRRLDQLRPYIAWWQHDAEPMAMLAAGAVLMTSAPGDQVIEAGRRLHRNFAFQSTGSIAALQSWAISATTMHESDAAALIAAATAQRLTDVPNALPFDAGYWRDNQAALTTRFDAWLKH